MNEDIHGTFSADISGGGSWRDRPFFKSLEALRPWLQWAVIVIMAVAVYYQSQRETNAQQSVSVADLQRAQAALQRTMDERTETADKRFEKMLTREVFEAYHSADTERMKRLETMVQQILEHQTR